MVHSKIFRYLLLLLFLINFTSRIDGIPIPNGQLGPVEVDCGNDAIDIVFLTEDIFQGRIFVVGHVNETDCVSRDIGKKTAAITIPKNKCGVATIRSSNPPGLYVNVKVMISFHDEFITKIDRGYEISCFYMQSEKTVTFPISVSPNTLKGFTENAEMPRCSYEIVDTITQAPVSVVSVGNKLLHKWTCESTAPDFWCMTVHSCFVEDGSGSEFVILNDDGCSIDRYLLDNLEYGPGLLQAQKEAHAFKFADRVIVNFQCSIRLDIREGECPIPKCPDLSKSRPRINKRSISSNNQTKLIQDSINGGYTEVDVRAQKMDVLDPQIVQRGNEAQKKKIFLGFGSDLTETVPFSHRSQTTDCISIEMLMVPSCAVAALVLILLSIIVWMTSRR